MIPARAVEAAIAAYYEHGEPDSEADELVAMRAAIEAAAPYIRAQAWEEGYTLGYADCANKQESNRPNPDMLNNEGEK